jgi:hypothetical protein
MTTDEREQDLAVELCMVAARWLRAHATNKPEINTNIGKVTIDLAPLRVWVQQDFKGDDVIGRVCAVDHTLRGAMTYENFWKRIVTSDNE